MKSVAKTYTVAFCKADEGVFISEKELEERLERLYEKCKAERLSLVFYCGEKEISCPLLSRAFETFRLAHPDLTFEKAYVAENTRAPFFMHGCDTTVYPPAGDGEERAKWLKAQTDLVIVYGRTLSRETRSA